MKIRDLCSVNKSNLRNQSDFHDTISIENSNYPLIICVLNSANIDSENNQENLME